MKRIMIFLLMLVTMAALTACDFFINNSTTTTTRTTTAALTESSSTTVNQNTTVSTTKPVTTSTTTATSTTATTNSTTYTTTTSTTTTTTTTITVDELEIFISAAEEMNTATLYGYVYSKIQTLDSFMVYQEYAKISVVSYEPLTAKVEYQVTNLADFDEEEQYHVTAYDLYFEGDNTFREEDGTRTDSDEIWTDIQMDIDISSLLDRTNFSNYEIDGRIFSATIPVAQASILFDESGLSDIQIEIGLDESNRLSTVNISYDIDGFSFIISYQFIFDAFTEEIMD